MRICVIFACQIMLIFVFAIRGYLLHPTRKILMQTIFIIVDKDAGGNMHGIYQTQSFFYRTFLDCLLYLRGNIDELLRCVVLNHKYSV